MEDTGECLSLFLFLSFPEEVCYAQPANKICWIWDSRDRETERGSLVQVLGTLLSLFVEVKGSRETVVHLVWFPHRMSQA